MKPSRQTKLVRFPAEWEPHVSTWLAWPHFKDDWPGKFQPIPWVYAEIIRNLGKHERIDLIVNDAHSEKGARKVLDRANALSENIVFHRWPTDRVWTRDSGCTFLFDESSSRSPQSSRAKSKDLALSAVTWRFNAWAKYPNYKNDQNIGKQMAKAASAKPIAPTHGETRVVLEGGSIESNGLGTLLATEECLLSTTQHRNPAMKKKDYERIFAEYLGISNVIWLGSGIAGDDTHGHVDDITRFVSPDTVVTAVESDPGDPNYEPLRANVQRLREAVDQNGHPLAIVELPMPGPVIFEGRRLPASYANFYIANGLVLVPVFNDSNDRVALDILADLFPDRDVVGIYSGDLIWGFGAMHCMTQQQPAIPATR